MAKSKARHHVIEFLVFHALKKDGMTVLLIGYGKCQDFEGLFNDTFKENKRSTVRTKYQRTFNISSDDNILKKALLPKIFCWQFLQLTPKFLLLCLMFIIFHGV